MAIDTLKFARRLEAAGVSSKQAEAEAEAIQEALEAGAATKSDLVEFRADLRAEITELRGKFNLLYWMIGFNLALTTAVLGKLLIG